MAEASAAKTKEAPVPQGARELAALTGREPSADVLDPSRAGAQRFEVPDEAGAKALAKKEGRQVAIPGHPLGHVARPDGNVGPRQPR